MVINIMAGIMTAVAFGAGIMAYIMENVSAKKLDKDSSKENN